MFNKKTICVWVTLLLTACISDPEYRSFPRNEIITKADVSQDLKTSDADTTADTDMCQNDTCAECEKNSDCVSAVCVKNTCVECESNSTCGEATKSKCLDNTCSKCITNDDCVHIPGFPRCDAGTCEIECEDDRHCNGTVCDVINNTCTDVSPLTAGPCESCVSDTQCELGFRCVAMTFGANTTYGNYCLEVKRNVGCLPPYTIGIRRESLSSTDSVLHCGIDQMNVTCEAILNAATSCKQDNDPTSADPTKCMTDLGGLCKNIITGWTCTYSCNSSRECEVNQPCNDYCGDI